MNEEDEISKLPDEILCKILSFLELRLAIQSSILSKRWKLLWTFLHDLDFYAPRMDSDRFYTPPLRRLPTDLDRRIFLCFVTGVLSNRDHTSKIGKIRLASPVNVDPVFVENCIHYAASHNVDELDLDAYCNTKPFRFPLNFFESRSLRKLRLRYYHASMIIPKPFRFPNLKVLYLEGFRFKDGDDFCFSKEPFSDFPDLEELTLDCCKIDDGLMILAPELKVCELIGIRTPSSGERRILKAEMRKLKSFKFQGDAFMVPLVEEPLCLDDVYLDAFPLARQEDEALQIKLIKFMEKLKNATTLSISLETIKEPFSGYPNLEELTLYGCRVDGLTILAPELKLLEFIDCEPQLSYESKILKAEMPKLESFVYVSQVSLVCPMMELPCLDMVYVDLCAQLIEPDAFEVEPDAFEVEPDAFEVEPDAFELEPGTNEVKEKMPINLFMLLEQLKNARSLTLSLNTIEVLSMDSNLIQQYPSPFVNLKHLKFFYVPEEMRKSLLTRDVMAYLTSASSFRDSMIVEYS